MISIDLIGVIAFIIFVVFKALGESNRQKQVHRRKHETREILRPDPMSPPPVAGPWEEVFPPVLSFPWEDGEEVREGEGEATEGTGIEGLKTQGAGAEGFGTEGAALAGVSTEGYGTEGGAFTKTTEVSGKESAGGKEQKKAGLPMEPAEVLRGFVWAEILQPPVSKRRAYNCSPAHNRWH